MAILAYFTDAQTEINQKIRQKWYPQPSISTMYAFGHKIYVKKEAK